MLPIAIRDDHVRALAVRFGRGNRQCAFRPVFFLNRTDTGGVVGLSLVDSIWFALLSVHFSRQVLDGGSKGWLDLVTLAIWMALTGLKCFGRFRGPRIEPAKKNA